MGGNKRAWRVRRTLSEFGARTAGIIDLNALISIIGINTTVILVDSGCTAMVISCNLLDAIEFRTDKHRQYNVSLTVTFANQPALRIRGGKSFY